MIAQSFPLAVQVAVPTSHWDGSWAVDLFAPCSTPVLAVFDGVAQAVDYPLGGHTVLLTAADDTEAYYAHMQANRTSGPVQAGEVIGYVSDSGNAAGTGCHLHFAVGRIDGNGAGTIAPWQWLNAAPDKPIVEVPEDLTTWMLIGLGFGLLIFLLE